ncbi:MAG: Ig-like domain-containing protein, partial [Myxococcales bacterium]
MRLGATRFAFAVASLAAVAACTDQPFTVDVALRVVSVVPSGNGEGFGRHRNLEIAFSEELDPATVTAESVLLEEIDGERIASAVTYSSETGTHLVTVDPAEPLKYSARYRLTLSTAIKRKRDGSPLAVKVTSTFKSEDPAPLRLVASTPSSGAEGFGRTGTLSLQFSEPLKCATLGKGVVITESFDPHPRTRRPDAIVAGTWECTEPTGEQALEGPIQCTEGDARLCTVTFKPADPKFAFEWSSRVTVALAGGRENENRLQSFRATADGGFLPQNLDVPFAVENPPAFTLAAVSPAAGATGVERKPAIALTFAEPIRCGTLLDASVLQLHEKRDAHPRLGGTTAPIAG